MTVIQEWDVWRRAVSCFVLTQGHSWCRNTKGNDIVVRVIEGAGLVQSVTDEAGNIWVRDDEDERFWTARKAEPASTITLDLLGVGDVQVQIAEIEP